MNRMNFPVNMAHTVAAVVFAVGIISSTPAGAQHGPWTIEVDSGSHDRCDTPVILPLPSTPPADAGFALSRLDTGRQLSVQRLPGTPTRVVWILGEPLRKGQRCRYRLRLAKVERPATPRVNCQDTEKHFQINVGDRRVLQYNKATISPPPGMESHYRRSGYIHPLWNSAGQAVTDDFAPDHPHQHGLFFAWTKTSFEGRPVNFWDQAGKQGRIEHVRIDHKNGGSVCAQFTATLRHRDMTAPGGSKAVLNETWTIRVYGHGDYHLFDFISRQTCASASPLTNNKYHYGGLAIRGSRQWFEQPGSDFLTGEGKSRADGNHTRPRWVDIFGKIDGKWSGVSIMDHPDNFRFPQPVRLHPQKPYFCYAPMVLGSFQIVPDKEYVSRFRYCIHQGKPDPKLLERLWQDFARPPVARVVRE